MSVTITDNPLQKVQSVIYENIVCRGLSVIHRAAMTMTWGSVGMPDQVELIQKRLNFVVHLVNSKEKTYQ